MSEVQYNEYTEAGDSADVVYNCDEAQDAYLVEDDTTDANEYEQLELHADNNGTEVENVDGSTSESAVAAADNSQSTSEYIVNLHGLPYNCNYDDIANFLEGCTIAGGVAGVHFCFGDDGRANGDAFVELSSAEDLKQALKKDRKHIGRRYVEVYKVDQKEMEFVLKRSSKEAVETRINKGDTDSVVRLRGLPFGCTKEEIANFFLGLAIAPGGILIVTDEMGRAAGDGFVQFTSPELVEKALEKNKEKIGHRYIEVFRSTSQEMQKRSRPPPLMSQRPGPYDRPDFGGRYGGRYGGKMGGNIKGFDGGRGGGYGGGMYGGRSGMGDYGRNFGSGSRYGGGGRDMYDSGRSRFGGGGGGGGGGMGARGDQRSGRGMREFHSSTGHYVYMRGLPYSSTERDIVKFFSPIEPVRVCFEYGSDGRPTGNANVDFECDASAREAMRKHKSLIEHRYIELFLNGVGASR